MLSQNDGDNLPIGTILPYNGLLSAIPTGWHLCDGTDGTPDLRDRFLQSYGTNTAMQFIEPGLPNIIGTFNTNARTSGSYNCEGVFTRMQNGTGTEGTLTASGSYRITFDASRSNSIYGRSTTVQPLAYTVYYIIKIA